MDISSAHIELIKRIIKEELDLSAYQNLKLISKANGRALFQMEDGNMLKTTEDVTEYKNAETLIKNPSPFFIKYFTAKSINDHYFELTMEKITPLSDKQWEIIDLIQNTLGRQDYMLDDAKRYAFLAELKRNPEFYEDFATYQEMVSYVSLIKKMYQAAKDRGIILHDLRAQNMGTTSDGRIVHFDLGSG